MIESKAENIGQAKRQLKTYKPDTIFLENAEKILVHKSMKEWESRLPEQSFCRIHRSTIINIEKVTKIDDWYNHSHLVTLEGLEKPLVMSRRYFSKVKDKLG